MYAPKPIPIGKTSLPKDLFLYKYLLTYTLGIRKLKPTDKPNKIE
jgi:hypothetical protein